MPTITYHHADGATEAVDVPPNTSIMRAALINNVRGIIGECGGQAMCATCHIRVKNDLANLPEISDDEDEMLDCTTEDRQDNSRLGCQLVAGRDFDSIEVDVPESQN